MREVEQTIASQGRNVEETQRQQQEIDRLKTLVQQLSTALSAQGRDGREQEDEPPPSYASDWGESRRATSMHSG